MRKIGLLAAVTVLLVLGVVAVAQAASAQDIYNDYRADGVLNGSYTNAELQAYLDDATVHQYGEQPVLTALDAVVRRMLSGESTTEDRDTFPFTGFEGVAVLLGSVLLLGSGLAVRRATR